MSGNLTWHTYLKTLILFFFVNKLIIQTRICVWFILSSDGLVHYIKHNCMVIICIRFSITYICTYILKLKLCSFSFKTLLLVNYLTESKGFSCLWIELKLQQGICVTCQIKPTITNKQTEVLVLNCALGCFSAHYTYDQELSILALLYHKVLSLGKLYTALFTTG